MPVTIIGAAVTLIVGVTLMAGCGVTLIGNIVTGCVTLFVSVVTLIAGVTLFDGVSMGINVTGDRGRAAGLVSTGNTCGSRNQ